MGGGPGAAEDSIGVCAGDTYGLELKADAMPVTACRTAGTGHSKREDNDGPVFRSLVARPHLHTQETLREGDIGSRDVSGDSSRVQGLEPKYARRDALRRGGWHVTRQARA